MKDSIEHGAVVAFQKLYAPAPPIRPAEKGACGSMPAAALQYCEAMRTASAYGFYVYPPKDIHLLYDGKETFYHENDQWYPLKSTCFEDEFRETWAAHAPADLSDRDPPFLTELFIPGMVQIWSGYLVQSAPDWSISLKPPVNYNVRSSFSVFEGIVETDEFCPMPLFINLQLHATHREIFIPAGKPLFQVQPVPRAAYQPGPNRLQVTNGFDGNPETVNWEGVRRTIRKAKPDPDYMPGGYATGRRKRD